MSRLRKRWIGWMIDLALLHFEDGFWQVDIQSAVGLAASLVGLRQAVQAAEGLCFKLQLGLIVAQPLDAHPARLDLHQACLRLSIQLDFKGKRRGDLLQPQTKPLDGSRGQHWYCSFRQVESRAALARLQVERAVGRRQRSRVGDMHPQTPRDKLAAGIQPAVDQREGIIGVFVVAVVDGKRREGGQIQARLCRQVRHFEGWLDQRYPQAGWVGVFECIPAAPFQQQGMGGLGSLAAPQLAEQAAVFAATERQIFGLAQVASVVERGRLYPARRRSRKSCQDWASFCRDWRWLVSRETSAAERAPRRRLASGSIGRRRPAPRSPRR